MPVTLTAIVTAHSEGRLLRPALRAVRAALTRSLSHGHSVELLIVADAADAVTLAQIEKEIESSDSSIHARAIRVSLGDAGAARNAAAHEARGRYVALIDGDDVVCSEYFTRALSVLMSAEAPIVVHPEFVISFGARSLLWHVRSASTGDVSYRDLVRHNLWPASCVLERQVLLDHPYQTMRGRPGYGPEDWLWNIETTTAGITHEVAHDTYFFYRVRDSGGVNNIHAASVLPSFPLDDLRRALPGARERMTPPAAPPMVPVSHRLYQAALPVARASTRWLSWDAKNAIYRFARKTVRTVTGCSHEDPVQHLKRSQNPALAAALREATAVEPALSWAAFSIDELVAWEARDDGYARVMEDALNQIGERGDALVMVPWLGVGGADMVSLNYAKALNETDEFRGRTTILGTFDITRTDYSLIPADLNYVHLDSLWLEFPLHVRQRLIAQLLVLLRPRLVVSVNCFHLLDALRAHAEPITETTDVYATLFSFDRIGDGYPTNPITDDGQRSWLDHIAGLLTDNSMSARLIDDILALPTAEVPVYVHRQPAAIESRPSHPPMRGSAEKNNTVRLLWPHRLDVEKRPDVLPRIARELERRGLSATIEVWGSRVLTDGKDTLMADLAATGVVYRGPYAGGLSAIDLSGYDALLLTSQNEGLPLVLVQSMLLGLPVIASRVGGVPDIVHDGETGLLADGPDDVDGYVRAVERIANEPGLRERLVSAGRTFALNNHSWAAFAAMVDRDLVTPRLRRSTEQGDPHGGETIA